MPHDSISRTDLIPFQKGLKDGEQPNPSKLAYYFRVASEEERRAFRRIRHRRAANVSSLDMEAALREAVEKVPIEVEFPDDAERRTAWIALLDARAEFQRLGAEVVKDREESGAHVPTDQGEDLIAKDPDLGPILAQLEATDAEYNKLKRWADRSWYPYRELMLHNESFWEATMDVSIGMFLERMERNDELIELTRASNGLLDKASYARVPVGDRGELASAILKAWTVTEEQAKN